MSLTVDIEVAAMVMNPKSMGLHFICVLGDNQFSAADNPSQSYGGIGKLKLFVHASIVFIYIFGRPLLPEKLARMAKNMTKTKAPVAVVPVWKIVPVSWGRKS